MNVGAAGLLLTGTDTSDPLEEATGNPRSYSMTASQMSVGEGGSRQGALYFVLAHSKVFQGFSTWNPICQNQY